jgi:16S rRNA (cytosine1402-N4)-methyltransferase
MNEINRDIYHKPVLLDKVIEYLITEKSGTYFDGTVGGGGHSKEILKNLNSNGKLIGIDVDSDVIEIAENNLKLYKDNLTLKMGNYADILEILKDKKADGILLDLGISSFQIDNPKRGFSYLTDCDLDMRMANNLGNKASDIISNYSKSELTEIFKKYGEERRSKIISSSIVKSRMKDKIKTSYELRKIIEKSIPNKNKIKTISRIFQSLRIEVNKELDNLENFLKIFTKTLKIGGRIVIISYHSLEDKLVKRYFKQFSKGCICPPNIPLCICGGEKLLKILTKKPVRPSRDEINTNPRARSAKLRAAERI